MKRRIWSAILTLVMLMSLLPAQALAAESEEPSVITAGGTLTGDTKKVYDVVAASLPDIAANGGSTLWPAAVTGVEELSMEDAEKVFCALYLDFPYEMYWRDAGYDGGDSFAIQVSANYRADGDECTVKAPDQRVAAALANAQKIVDAAKDLSDLGKLAYFREAICDLVIYDHSAFGDGTKYDTTGGKGMPYGDPWQMISVFDGDEETNVVCEGYSKAFKYLCDKAFPDGPVRCWTVTGELVPAATKGGPHMWNIVTLDGENYYLVDVTHCDLGDMTDNTEMYKSGYPYSLFLAGARGSVEDGYTVALPSRLLKQETDGDGVKTYKAPETTITYVYHEEATMPIWGGTGILNLSSRPYPIFYDIMEPYLFVEQTYEWTPALTENVTYSAAAASGEYALPQGASLDTKTGKLTYTPPAEAKGQDISITVAVTYQGNAEPYYYTLQLPEIVTLDTPLSRAQMVQALYCLEGKPSVTGSSSFPDVSADAWYADAVSWAVAKGIVKGYPDGRFAPEDSVTHEQEMVMLWRYNGSPAASPGALDAFPDAADVSPWAVEAMRWAVEDGYLDGRRLDPAGIATC